MRKMWEIKQSAAAAETLDMYIYGSVESNWYDWFGDKHESETSAEYFRQELAKHPDVKNINIYINSLGGSVYEGTAIYNQLRRHKAFKTVYIDGYACSIASVIAMAGDKVVMPKNTLMMIHDPWVGVVGNAAQLRKAADDLDTVAAASRQAYLVKAGSKLKEDKLISMLEAETYLTAEKCIEYGLADEYAEQDADLEAAKAALESSVNQSDSKTDRFRAEITQLERLRSEAAERIKREAAEEARLEIRQRREKAVAAVTNYFA